MQIVVLLALAMLEQQAPSQRSTDRYPIAVAVREGNCQFLVQDMWLSDVAQLEGWMTALPDKALPIEIIWRDDLGLRCMGPAREAVDRSGFKDIRFEADISGMLVMAEPQDVRSDHLSVTSVVRAGCLSGIFACWDRVSGVTRNGIAIDLFSLSMTGDEARPLVGDTCNVSHHSGRLGGSLGDRLPQSGPWRVIDQMDCTSSS